MPRGFERAILREYLQSELIVALYAQPDSESLALIGGTGLRLLHDLDRFSEDLDFDWCGERLMGPSSLFARAVAGLQTRGYALRWAAKRAGEDRGGKLYFNALLFALGLTPNRDENIMIKLEYTMPRPAPERTVALMSRFGFVVQVTTEPLPVLCARKILALFGRARIQPRDLYDLTWFFSRRIAPDFATLARAQIASPEALSARVAHLWRTVAPHLNAYERDLLPLLMIPAHAARIRLLPELLQKTIG